MNEPEKETPETPATERSSEAPAMGPTATTQSKDELEATEQSKSQPDPDTGSGEPRIELVTPEELAEGELPEPSEHVIREYVPGLRQPTVPETAKASEPAQPNKMPESLEETDRGWKDPSGRYFDARKHQHTNGFPETSPKGYLRPWSTAHEKAGLHLRSEGLAGFAEPETKRKGSLLDRAKRFFAGEPERKPEPKPETRKPATEAGPQTTQYANGGLVGTPQSSQESQSAGKQSKAATAAAQLVAMEEMIAVMVFSEEWQFLSEERKGLVIAWTRTFEEKGVVETPWWMELAASHAVIFANRADKPKTREKLGKMKASIMKKVIDFRTANAPAQTRKEER